MSNANSIDDFDDILEDIFHTDPVVKPRQQHTNVKGSSGTKKSAASLRSGKEQKVQQKISSFFLSEEPKLKTYTLDMLLEEKEREEEEKQELKRQGSKDSIGEEEEADSDNTGSELGGSAEKTKQTHRDKTTTKDTHKSGHFESVPPSKKAKKDDWEMDMEGLYDFCDAELEEDSNFASIDSVTMMLRSKRLEKEKKVMNRSFFRNRVQLPDMSKAPSPEGKTLKEWEAIANAGLLSHAVALVDTDLRRESVLGWLFRVAGSHTDKRLVQNIAEQLQHIPIANTGTLLLEMLKAHGGNIPGHRSTDSTKEEEEEEEPTLDESLEARKSLPNRDHNLAAMLQVTCSDEAYPPERMPENVVIPLFQCLIEIVLDPYYSPQDQEQKSLDASRTISLTRALINKVIVAGWAKGISFIEPLLGERSGQESYKLALKRIEAVPMWSSKSRILRLNAAWTALTSLANVSSGEEEGYSIETLTEIVVPTIKSAPNKKIGDLIARIAVPSILNDLRLADDIAIDKNVKSIQDFVNAIEPKVRKLPMSPSSQEDVFLFIDFLKTIINECEQN